MGLALVIIGIVWLIVGYPILTVLYPVWGWMSFVVSLVFTVVGAMGVLDDTNL